jgi:hypothetical protein
MWATDEIEPGIISENLIHCPLTFFIDDYEIATLLLWRDSVI